MISRRATEPVLPKLSVAVTVKAWLPTANDRPLMRPALDRVIPEGRVPAVTA